MDTIGANIREARDRLELSQAELARRAKVSPTTVNGIEKARLRDLRLSTLVNIAQVLEMDVARICRASDLDISESDQSRLLKVSDELFRISRRVKKSD